MRDQKPEQTADSSTEIENSSPETAVLLTRPFLTSARGSAEKMAEPYMRKEYLKILQQQHLNEKFHKDANFTQIEASWHLQVRTLAKVIHGRDAELVAGLLSEVGDTNLC